MRVHVYKNLTRGCWSIRCAERGHAQKGKVIGHRDSVVITGAKMVVRTNGRDRMIKESKRYVHAWIEGDLVEDQAQAIGESFTYLPWESDHYQIRSTGDRITAAAAVHFTESRGCYAVDPSKESI